MASLLLDYPFLHRMVSTGDEPAHASPFLDALGTGDFHKILISPAAKSVLSQEAGDRTDTLSTQAPPPRWEYFIRENISFAIEGQARVDDPLTSRDILLVGIAAFEAFLQSNVTGPPLKWNSADVVLPIKVQIGPRDVESLRKQLNSILTTDGEAVYHLAPHVELFCLAKIILNHPLIIGEQDVTRWARLRVNAWHQYLLNDNSSSLQNLIYDDLEYVGSKILFKDTGYLPDEKVKFLLERAAINTHHGFDMKAREDLAIATKMTGLTYALSGRLGKRTKFQEKEYSQLVVLARSLESENASQQSATASSSDHHAPRNGEFAVSKSKPKNLDLNDDTLLESISFSEIASNLEVRSEESLPQSLLKLDPAKQPILKPLDSIILLSLASSITNTSPQHGLTREETLPYATRVLDGGSTNWQIYTQALLVRSRIEGFKSRTVERGVLQLQALVDQVIAQTTHSNPIDPSSPDDSKGDGQGNPTTFLPRPKSSDSAPAFERLLYIHQLASPTRWTLEAELAARWVSLGGVRTALEIYERLEMWAEAALCWAAVDREDKARRIVRRQLYLPSPSTDATWTSQKNESSDNDIENYLGGEIVSLPADAPRLFCILGDIDKSSGFYERAWTVSNHRYARAQRSLGKHYTTLGDLPKANDAYSKSLKVNPLNQNTWFALGCIRLELRDWSGAVDAFGHSVKIEESDAEAWSNLAAALLRLPPEESPVQSTDNDVELEERGKRDPQRHTKEAFVAFKRAANLKRESYRIWQNLLNVAATLSPPPYTDIVIAQQRLIELRGSIEGESCIDVEIIEGLLSHVIASASERPAPNDLALLGDPESEQRRQKFGLEHMLTDLILKQVTPLITHSRRLWQLIARLSLHLNRPSSALDAYEKAWRVTLNKPGWDDGSSSSSGSTAETPNQAWSEVIESTTELIDAYESLGPRERTEGLGAGSGELVSKQWKYKSRMAIKAVMGRREKGGKWEGMWKGFESLKEQLELLKPGRGSSDA